MKLFKGIMIGLQASLVLWGCIWALAKLASAGV